MTWGKAIPWILLTVIAVLFFFYLKGCFTPGGVDKEGQLRDSVFFWKDSAGRAVTSVRAQAADFAFIQKSYKDSIAGLLKTKAENLQEIVNLKEKGQVIITVPGNAPPPKIVYKDTGHTEIGSVSQVFSNPWYQAVAVIDLTNNLGSSLQLQTFDTLSLTWNTGHTGNFFTRKNYLQLNVKNANPYNQITKVEAYRVPPLPPKKWGIGLGIGWGYGFNITGAQWGYPIIGITVQRNFIRF